MPHRPRTVLAVLGATGLSAAIAACGSSAQTPPATTTRQAVTVADAGTTPPILASPAASGTARCRATTVATLAGVAKRIYFQGAHGRNGANAMRRLGRSSALADAVASGNHAATITALQPLLKHQILHITIRHRSKVVADVGHVPVMSPVHGRLYTSGGALAGTYVLSVMNPASFAGITSGLTGSTVIVRSGSRHVAGGAAAPGVHYRTVTFRGTAFPSGPLRISVMVPPSALRSCAAGGRVSATDVLGKVAMRLFDAETRGSRVQQALNYVAHDKAYRTALAARDRAGITAAVRDGFFHVRRYHMVRVRGSRGRNFVVDVGGPFVLAPASMTLRGPGGRNEGKITLAIQDDTGYIKLLTRFTGGAVILRERGVLVPGSTFDPAPAHIPKRGVVTWHGRRYDAISFTGRAFPSGPLRISLLVPLR
ncbi:MAG TPA: hypothetical protein VII98_10075 [Solirubrobacteraceae bacterium]